MDQDTQADDAGAATDAATINSDAAVLEGVQQLPKRHEGDNPTPPPPQEAEVMNHCSGDPAAAGGITGDAKTGNAEARRRHYRKRGLSSATAGTVETLPSTSNGRGNISDVNGLSGLSLMQNSAVGSNIMSSGVDHSIVSFGLNFNFDNTSSPSNSDSGEGGETKKKKVAANGSADKKPAAKQTTTPQAATGSNEGKNNKGSSSNKGPNKTGKSSKKASPSGNGGEDGSDPNSSDSSLNNDSGGSASGGDSNSGSGSGSGGDGSGGSGWKSTISSLTTSSNQEWLATNESAAAAVAAAETGAVANNATADANLSAKKVETGV